MNRDINGLQRGYDKPDARSTLSSRPRWPGGAHQLNPGNVRRQGMEIGLEQRLFSRQCFLKLFVVKDQFSKNSLQINAFIKKTTNKKLLWWCQITIKVSKCWLLISVLTLWEAVTSSNELWVALCWWLKRSCLILCVCSIIVVLFANCLMSRGWKFESESSSIGWAACLLANVLIWTLWKMPVVLIQ